MDKDKTIENDFNLKQDGVVSTSEDFYKNLMCRMAKEENIDTSTVKTKYGAIATVLIFLALNIVIGYTYMNSNSSQEQSSQPELDDQLFGTVEVYSY